MEEENRDEDQEIEQQKKLRLLDAEDTGGRAGNRFNKKTNRDGEFNKFSREDQFTAGDRPDEQEEAPEGGG